MGRKWGVIWIAFPIVTGNDYQMDSSRPPPPTFAAPHGSTNTKSTLNNILLLLLKLRDSRIRQVQSIHDDLRWSEPNPLPNADIRKVVCLKDFDENNVVLADVLDVVGHVFGDVSAVACVVVECASVAFGSLGRVRCGKVV